MENQKPNIEISTNTTTSQVNSAETPIKTTDIDVPKNSGNLSKKLLIILGIITLICLVIFILSLNQQKLFNLFPKNASSPSPTPTIDIKNQTLHPIATNSAYLNIVSEISSLSASLNSYNPADVTIKPPELDLPLGFSNSQ